MRSTKRRTPSADLAKLKDAVSQWREAGGGRGSRIPEWMWNEAVRLAGIDGMWWTARVLRFKYESLKRRMELDGGRDRERAAARAARKLQPTASTAPADEQTHEQRRRSRRARTRPATTTSRSTTRVARPGPSPEFIELSPLVGASSSASPSTTTTGTVIEVEDPGGTRLVVRLAKDTRVDVATLIWAFRRRAGRGA